MNKEMAELRNNADSMIFTAEKTKKDVADKITDEQQKKIDDAITALKDALATTNTEEIKTKSEELTKILQEIGTTVYQQAASEYAKQKGQTTETPQADSEKVVDSDDYKVK